MGTNQNIIMTPELMTSDDHRTSAEIEEKIRHTRGRMDSTLDELGSRLTARSLVNSALDWWDSPLEGNRGNTAVRKAASTLGRQVRRHPIPAALIGAGVAWLVSESAAPEDDDIPKGNRSRWDPLSDPYEQDGDTTGRMSDWVDDKTSVVKGVATDTVDAIREKSARIGDKVHQAKDLLGNQAHEALDRGKSVARKLKNELADGYQTGSEKFTQACDEYPLAVGVAFAAMGALVGIVIPGTRREDELMGDQADKLIKETKERASELLETGKEVGARVLETAKDEAREQGFMVDDIGKGIADFAERGSQVFRKAKEEVIHAAEEKGLNVSPQPPATGADI